VLLFSFFLVVFGGGPDPALAVVHPSWTPLVTAYTILTDTCTLLLFYLFPTGHFVPRWTRWIAFATFLGNVVVILFPDSPLATLPSAATVPVTIGLFGIAIVAQVYRYVRVSTPLERQQTKWVLLALGIFLLVDSGRTIQEAGGTAPAWVELGVGTLEELAGLLVPIAIAISISRYRLWDIDALINRVLVYGLLTTMLGALYAGLIIGSQALLSRFTGQSNESPPLIVVSTLAIAALVLPARRRLQILVDRRFYRQKYDAEQTLAAFSATLSQQVDMEHMQQQLLAVVQETMQPTHVSLWLRQSAPPRAELA
jgi:hypothetical protein